jgi:hypothetical protein
MMIMGRTSMLLSRHSETPWLGPQGRAAAHLAAGRPKEGRIMCVTDATYGSREVNPTTGSLNRHGLCTRAWAKSIPDDMSSNAYGVS